MKLRAWLFGLIGGTIQGAASTVLTWASMSGLNAAGVNVPKLNWGSLGVLLSVSCLSHSAAFLMKSPLPDFTETVTTTSSVTVTQQGNVEPPTTPTTKPPTV